MTLCRQCFLSLSRRDDNFCPDGHTQYDYILDDEDEVVELSAREPTPSARSNRQTIQNVRPRPNPFKQLRTPPATPTSVQRRPAQASGIKKEKPYNQLSRSERNEPRYAQQPVSKILIKRVVNIWLCEPVPTKPANCHCPFSIFVDPKVPLQTPKQVDDWITHTIEGSPAMSEHSQLLSGELKIDDARRATIGRKQHGRYPVSTHIQRYASVNSLVTDFGDDQKSAKSEIHFLVPVKRGPKRAVVSTSGSGSNASVFVEEEPVVRRGFIVPPSYDSD